MKTKMKTKTYVHSTTPEGLIELLNRQDHPMHQEEYLSVSSVGCSKYIEKGYETVYVLVECPDEDVRFSAIGDVGWEGGDPRNTTYDEIGLNSYDVKKIIVPKYYRDNKKATGMAIVAQMILRDEMDIDIPIECDPKVRETVHQELEEMWDDDEEIETYYEKIITAYRF